MKTQESLPAPAPQASPRLLGDLTLGGRVVVGSDGSWHSRAALDRAAQEAVTRGLALTVLTVVSTAVDAGWSGREQVTKGGEGLGLARARADAAVSRLSGRRDLTAAAVVLADTDTSGLRDLLADCRLLVVGDHGDNGSRSFLLGTTSRDLVRAVACPVLVVPDDWQEPVRTAHNGGRILLQDAVLVGVGNGPESVVALRVAAQEARRTGSPLFALHSYARATLMPAGRLPTTARAVLDDQLRSAGLADDERITTELTPDPAVEALLRQSRLVRLLVIGSRGPLALARLTLDSVSRAVLDGATTPVMIVPAGTVVT